MGVGPPGYARTRLCAPPPSRGWMGMPVDAAGAPPGQAQRSARTQGRGGVRGQGVAWTRLGGICMARTRHLKGSVEAGGLRSSGTRDSGAKVVELGTPLPHSLGLWRMRVRAVPPVRSPGEGWPQDRVCGSVLPSLHCRSAVRATPRHVRHPAGQETPMGGASKYAARALPLPHSFSLPPHRQKPTTAPHVRCAV